MILVSVYDVSSSLVLYRLLGERTEGVNISHKEMPTMAEHKMFIERFPYHAWYLIMGHDEVLGAIYLTRNNEIGISLFKKHQGKGIATVAIKDLMAAHPRPQYYANINPGNERSIKMFGHLGFRHLQNTYVVEAKRIYHPGCIL